MSWSEDEEDEQMHTIGIPKQERCQEFNNGASRNILHLHKDRPDVQRRVDRAFQILYQDSLQMKFSNEVILETLLTVLENCGDFEVQVSAMKILLGRDHVLSYKKWFAKAWFDGRPLTTQAFIALRHSFDEEDIRNFLSVYNSEPLEFGFVFSIRCSLVSWNQTPMTPALKGSPCLHLNCGTKSLLVSNVTPPPECNKRNLFFFYGTDVRKATVFYQRQKYGSHLQGLSIYTSKGHLVVHPDPLIIGEGWKKVEDFLKYISNVSLETSSEKEMPGVLLDINGNIIAESNLKNFNVDFEDADVEYKPTNNVKQPSFAHVSSSQDDFGGIPAKVETHEVGVQVMSVEIGTVTTPKVTLETLDNPVAPVKEETDCLSSDAALPATPLDDTAGNSSLDMSGNSEYIPESTLLQSPKIVKHGRKKFGRKPKTALKTDIHEHADEMKPPVHEFERKQACRRVTRSLVKVIGGDLEPGFSMYGPLCKKRKKSICPTQTVDMNEDTVSELVASEICDHTVAPNSLELVNKIAKSGTCSQGSNGAYELKLEDTASELPDVSQAYCSSEDVDEPVIQPHSHNMPSLMTPCATPLRGMTDFGNITELNMESKSEGVGQHQRGCSKDGLEQDEDKCQKSDANVECRKDGQEEDQCPKPYVEDEVEEQGEHSKQRSWDKYVQSEQKVKGPPPAVPLYSNMKRCKLLNDSLTLKQLDDAHQPSDDWKVEIEPCKNSNRFESVPISPRGMDSSSDTSFMDTADALDCAVLLPIGNASDTLVEI